MSRAFSSKKPLPPAPTATPATSCAKSAHPRNPLQDLNRISSSSNSSDSSNVSTEAPRGCLRFFLSNSSSSSSKTPVNRTKYLSKAPNSAPNVLPSKQSNCNSSKENLSKGNTGGHAKILTSEKLQKLKKNPPCLYQWQSGKKSGSKSGQKSKPCSVLNDHGQFLPRLPSASEKLKQLEDSLEGINENASERAQPRSCHDEANFTPMNKKATGSDLNTSAERGVKENSHTSISRTPPIQNSVSPEIQCGSSLVSTTTPACFGAGYVVSGVTDKRKCKPRGILTVERNNSGIVKMAADSFDNDDEKKVASFNNNANDSLLPLPTEASMLWLSSPQDKGEKDLSGKYEIGLLNQARGLAESATLVSSPSSNHRISLDMSNSSNLSSAATSIRRKMISSISPIDLPDFQGFSDSIISPSYLPIFFPPNSTPSCWVGSSEKGKNYKYNLTDEKSPVSLNSLGSGNVIQTPESDSSSDLHVGLSWVHEDNQEEDHFNHDLDSTSEVFPSASFFLNGSVPFRDSRNSSFQFDPLPVPSDSIDLTRLPKTLNDQDPWLSSSTIENASQSEMRISWREGLISQLYELDEFDSCRCLSDEEDFANNYSSNKLPMDHGPQVNVEDGNKKLNTDVTYDDELGNDGLGREIFPAVVSYSGAESISTDGGSLVASRDDSDWNLCYKNQLFEV